MVAPGWVVRHASVAEISSILGTNAKPKEKNIEEDLVVNARKPFLNYTWDSFIIKKLLPQKACFYPMKPSTDLRRYARQTNWHLVVGFLLILFIVGDGLIYIFYGRWAAAMGALCLLIGLSPLLLIWLALAIMGWLKRKLDEG